MTHNTTAAAPATGTAAEKSNRHQAADGTSIAPGTDCVDLLGIVSGALVVVVKLDGDHYRRRTFLTLKAAERAVERAQARGHQAEVVLCSLQPVEGGSL
ncbi:hypothetical protein AB2L28_00860 [Kineococcus sp. TBRC 1896]|uniref:Uncharacterized protein n=1 Tax=Kineococcus mangrovi TaxID=1660183 RepID=A0ABV4HWI6_9ACTN